MPFAVFHDVNVETQYLASPNRRNILRVPWRQRRDAQYCVADAVFHGVNVETHYLASPNQRKILRLYRRRCGSSHSCPKSVRPFSKANKADVVTMQPITTG